MSRTLTQTEEKKTLTSRRELPLDPPVSVKDLRDCIPAHCWKRDNLTSFGYLVKDILLISITGWLAYTFIDSVPFFAVRVALWIAYVFFQGVWGTGLWVLAHEAGHRAFSESDVINDTVGLICHSFLLVPYHAWRLSHHSHHANTGNFDKDEVHIPNTRKEMKGKLPFTKMQALTRYLKSVLLGWPAYLLWNASSNRSRQGRVNHFEPSSPLFKDNERHLIVISDIALAVWAVGLYWIYTQVGLRLLILLYFLPYLHVNHWLVLITKLQHSQKNLPHYADKDWTWLRGQLTTIDRSFGWFFDTFFHHIQDTHVCHHLFSRLPHYHAQEATQALAKKLGPYYQRCEDSVVTQTVECFTDCVFVEDDPDDGIYWWMQH
eukprot:TRINITY_DN532_c0_g1_i1.p1 TRINITY_DN532_c0_g1~~TRINITY_DN532_c0_g1_i1.p1  ORF type:complete len:376 (-),score=37.52 TRINITY_DN532_c0_g1_i1:22-1149(-)